MLPDALWPDWAWRYTRIGEARILAPTLFDTFCPVARAPPAQPVLQWTSGDTSMRPFPPYYSAKYGDGDEVRRCTLVIVDIRA